MAQPLSSPHLVTSAAPAGRGTVRVVAGGIVGAVIVLGTLALWARYGTAVFFDMITSGIAACV
jgi:hypothetical protein